jgi:hypothetical protein
MTMSSLRVRHCVDALYVRAFSRPGRAAQRFDAHDFPVPEECVLQAIAPLGALMKFV